MNRRPHAGMIVGAALATTLLVTACTPGSAPDSIGSGVDPEGTIEFWHFFTEREAEAIQAVVHDFEAAHPKIHVVIKSGQDDAKMTQAISAGQGPRPGAVLFD